MLTDETIAKLKAEYGNGLTRLQSDAMPNVDVVVRKPSRPEFERFHEEINGEHASTAMQTLMRSIVVYPDAAGFHALLEQYPGIPQEFGKEVTKLVGIAGKARASAL